MAVMMKKRILFVVDDEQEVRHLQQCLLQRSAQWEASFASRGEDAIGLFAAAPFDAVVADKRLADMDGLEFLDYISKTHPRALRFLFTGAGENDLILACVWGNHQSISKPVTQSALISGIHRALALDVWLSNPNVKSLANRVGSFPSLPAAYFEVLKRLESPNASLDTVGEAISKDPAMTVKLLQMVNSAFFALPQKISNPTEAITLLGVDTVKSILLCIQVFTRFDKVPSSLMSIDGLWAHSLAVGSLARKIVSAETGDQQMAEDAFTAGLLHDLGKLLLASNLGEDYRRVLELARDERIPLWQMEERELQATHAEIGGYLLGLWGMPVPLIEAVAFHHRPGVLQDPAFSLLTAVHAADVIENELRTGAAPWPGAALDGSYLRQLGLMDSLERWREIAQGKPVVARPSPASSNEPRSEVVSGKPGTAQAPGASGSLWQALRVPLAAAAALVFGVWLVLQQGQSWRQLIGTPDTASEEASDPVIRPVAAEESGQHAVAPLTAVADPLVKEASVEPSQAAPTAEKPAPPTLTLSGIFYSDSTPSARINRKLLHAGDMVDGAKVISIGRSDVTLERDGETLVLSMR